MKFNVEINIDWIDENQNIDDVIKDEIIDTVSSSIRGILLPSIKEKINESLSVTMKETTDSLINDLLNQPVVISDGYKREEFDSGFEMVRQKMSSLYGEKFSNSCGKDHIIERLRDHIKYETNSMLSKMEDTIKREAKKIANEEIKNSELQKAINRLSNDL